MQRSSSETPKKPKKQSYIQLKCDLCKMIFIRKQYDFSSKTKKFPDRKCFCSKTCQNKSQQTLKNTFCAQCKKPITRIPSQMKGFNNFCTQSCAATYNNTHKKYGMRRSKLEMYLEKELVNLYPALEFHFNRKDAINSELDIYIPSLKLAFELNGIFHYEPIFGADQLNKIQNNDQRKFQACLENGIELCIIDSSKFAKFKENEAKKFLDIIGNIISIKAGAP